MFNVSCGEWRVLKMSPRGVHSTAADQAPMTVEAAEAAKPAAEARQQQQQGQQGQGQQQAEGAQLRFGFIGNGVTPTNHLAVQWFLKSVWPSVRASLPNVRLRLVGYAPDDRPRKVQHTPCAPAGSAVRCGWAWQTVYAGDEASGGVDELGFISDEDMLKELLSWRGMVVPILRSTGVNTKILPALQVSGKRRCGAERDGDTTAPLLSRSLTALTSPLCACSLRALSGESPSSSPPSLPPLSASPRATTRWPSSLTPQPPSLRR